MNYAIIAAGQGSRLKQEGIEKPKPLVELNGEPLIARIIRIFSQNNAESINVIVNEEMLEVRNFLKNIKVDCELNIVVKTTESSLHSFYELSKVMRKGAFCLATVDTVFREDEFSEYIKVFEQDVYNDGVMLVTPFVDDEKPLYVEVDKEMFIKSFLDNGDTKYVSGGVYALKGEAFKVLDDCMNRGVSRMRNFQRALLEAGLRLKAFSINKVVDVDHASDVQEAERLLRGE